VQVDCFGSSSLLLRKANEATITLVSSATNDRCNGKGFSITNSVIAAIAGHCHRWLIVAVKRICFRDFGGTMEAAASFATRNEYKDGNWIWFFLPLAQILPSTQHQHQQTAVISHLRQHGNSGTWWRGNGRQPCPSRVPRNC
jgi:hypothetical protein